MVGYESLLSLNKIMFFLISDLPVSLAFESVLLSHSLAVTSDEQFKGLFSRVWPCPCRKENESLLIHSAGLICES